MASNGRRPRSYSPEDWSSRGRRSRSYSPEERSSRNRRRWRETYDREDPDRLSPEAHFRHLAKRQSERMRAQTKWRKSREATRNRKNPVLSLAERIVIAKLDPENFSMEATRSPELQKAVSMTPRPSLSDLIQQYRRVQVVDKEASLPVIDEVKDTQDHAEVVQSGAQQPIHANDKEGTVLDLWRASDSRSRSVAGNIGTRDNSRSLNSRQSGDEKPSASSSMMDVRVSREGSSRSKGSVRINPDALKFLSNLSLIQLDGTERTAEPHQQADNSTEIAAGMDGATETTHAQNVTDDSGGADVDLGNRTPNSEQQAESYQKSNSGHRKTMSAKSHSKESVLQEERSGPESVGSVNSTKTNNSNLSAKLEGQNSTLSLTTKEASENMPESIQADVSIPADLRASNLMIKETLDHEQGRVKDSTTNPIDQTTPIEKRQSAHKNDLTQMVTTKKNVQCTDFSDDDSNIEKMQKTPPRLKQNRGTQYESSPDLHQGWQQSQESGVKSASPTTPVPPLIADQATNTNAESAGSKSHGPASENSDSKTHTSGPTMDGKQSRNGKSHKSGQPVDGRQSMNSISNRPEPTIDGPQSSNIASHSSELTIDGSQSENGTTHNPEPRGDVCKSTAIINSEPSVDHRTGSEDSKHNDILIDADPKQTERASPAIDNETQPPVTNVHLDEKLDHVDSSCAPVVPSISAEKAEKDEAQRMCSPETEERVDHPLSVRDDLSLPEEARAGSSVDLSQDETGRSPQSGHKPVSSGREKYVECQRDFHPENNPNHESEHNNASRDSSPDQSTVNSNSSPDLSQKPKSSSKPASRENDTQSKASQKQGTVAGVAQTQEDCVRSPADRQDANSAHRPSPDRHERSTDVQRDESYCRSGRNDGETSTEASLSQRYDKGLDSTPRPLQPDEAIRTAQSPHDSDGRKSMRRQSNAGKADCVLPRENSDGHHKTGAEDKNSFSPDTKKSGQCVSKTDKQSVAPDSSSDFATQGGVETVKAGRRMSQDSSDSPSRNCEPTDTSETRTSGDKHSFLHDTVDDRYSKTKVNDKSIKNKNSNEIHVQNNESEDRSSENKESNRTFYAREESRDKPIGNNGSTDTSIHNKAPNRKQQKNTDIKNTSGENDETTRRLSKNKDPNSRNLRNSDSNDRGRGVLKEEINFQYQTVNIHTREKSLPGVEYRTRELSGIVTRPSHNSDREEIDEYDDDDVDDDAADDDDRIYDFIGITRERSFTLPELVYKKDLKRSDVITPRRRRYDDVIHKTDVARSKLPAVVSKGRNNADAYSTSSRRITSLAGTEGRARKQATSPKLPSLFSAPRLGDSEAKKGSRPVDHGQGHVTLPEINRTAGLVGRADVGQGDGRRHRILGLYQELKHFNVNCRGTATLRVNVSKRTSDFDMCIEWGRAHPKEANAAVRHYNFADTAVTNSVPMGESGVANLPRVRNYYHHSGRGLRKTFRRNYSEECLFLDSDDDALPSIELRQSGGGDGLYPDVTWFIQPGVPSERCDRGFSAGLARDVKSKAWGSLRNKCMPKVHIMRALEMKSFTGVPKLRLKFKHTKHFRLPP